MSCYQGKILWIDLEKKKSETTTVPKEWYKKYIGGEGFATKLLYDNLKPKTDPLGKNNLLVLSPGPLTGSIVPCSSRMSVGFRSPLTGTIGMANVGGFLGPMIKKTGHDLIVVSGKAASPTYIYIKDSQVEFKDARAIWGMDTTVTEEMIRKELNNEKAIMATIGVAGEKMVKFASVITDGKRAAARGGPGAVMGSKNLKAIAFYGSSNIKASDKEKMQDLARETRKDLKNNYLTEEVLKPYSTVAVLQPTSALGLLATKNWQHSSFHAADKIGTEAFYEKLIVRNETCHACPVVCKRTTEIPEGKYAGEKGSGPEFEGLASFGAKCGVDDLYSVTMANYLCNRLGMDVISVGQIIATVMEWYEKGIVNKQVTNNLEINFGNGDAMIEMVKNIGNREGFGDVLAEGSIQAANKVGGEARSYIMHSKGMELPVFDVRASDGRAISYLTSERGACHLRPTAPATPKGAIQYEEPELDLNGVSALKSQNKKWVKSLKEYFLSANMLGVCIFTVAGMAVKPSSMVTLYNVASGENIQLNDLLKSSERVINLQRMFNSREGFNRNDDTLPEKLLKEPTKEGVLKGQVLNKDEILDEYYELMGWDKETGLPFNEKLEELDLL